MPNSTLKEHVSQVMARPDALDAFSARIRELQESDETFTGVETETLIDLGRDYVEAVVVLIGQSWRAADKEGVRHYATALLKTAGDYFVDADDLIPDDQGLYGLIDDAYLAHSFIIRLSETIEAEKGFPLLANLHAELAPRIRSIIGDEIGAKLDARVEENLKSVIVRTQMARLSALSGTLPNGALELFGKVAIRTEKLGQAQGD